MPRTSYALKTLGSSTAAMLRTREEHVADQPRRDGVRSFADHRRGPLELPERVAQRLGPQRPLSVGEVLRLVAIRVLNVTEVDVERCAGLEHGIRSGERSGEGIRLEVGAVAGGVHVGEVENR